jgi:hypothetical protein
MAILLYSSNETLPLRTFFSTLNNVLRDNKRNLSTPFLRYIYLLLWAIREPVPGCGEVDIAPQGTVVYRGVNVDLRGQYPVGSEPVWHQFTSTSELEDAAQRFFDYSPSYTMFVITLATRRAGRIWHHSVFPHEREVLLPPGSRFTVTRVTVAGNESRIEMLELPPYEATLEYGDFIPRVGQLVSVSDN